MTKLTWDNAVLMSPATAARFEAYGDAGRPRRRARPGDDRRRRAAVSRAVGARRGVRRRRASRRLGDRAPRLRPPARGARGHAAPGFNAYAHPDVRRPLARRRPRSGAHRRALSARLHAVSPPDGRPRAWSARSRATSSCAIRSRCAKGLASKPRRRERSRSIRPTTSTTATSGAWRSTSTRASAATRASSPARPRTTSRSSARIRCCAAARCTGFASTPTTAASPSSPETYFQPVPCMQCENAPCEVVCPVGATVHSAEGLNDMVYNRCVGTRYCSNNCPYKVRRFNFLLYQDWDTPSLKLLRNPDVTRAQPRRDGEVHVLRAAHQRGQDRRRRKQDRAVRDGEIVTACQQACPADAIVFGNLNDPKSRVAAAAGRAAQLRAARRAEHAAAHDVSRRRAQPESGARKADGLRRPRRSDRRRRRSWRPGLHLRVRHGQDQRDRAARNGRRAAGSSVSAPPSCCAMLLFVSLSRTRRQGHRHLGQQPCRSAGRSTSSTSSGGSASATRAR